MAMQKADDVVSQLSIDINDKQNLLEAVNHLQAIYPELLIQREDKISSMHSVKFSAASSNKLAEDVDIITRRHEEVCDQDIVVITEIVEAWPYTTIDGYKVYSNPPCFAIGDVNANGFGMIPKLNWEEDMEKADISSAAIRKTRSHVKANPPISYSE